MKHSQLYLFIVLLIAAIALLGCSSSTQSSKGEQEETNPPAPPKPAETRTIKKEQPPPSAVDTVSVDVQNTKKPSYESKDTRSPATPTGRYSVQVGAYKMADNADRIAALAKERYNRSVYTVQDPSDNLYKVMIGDFTTKDEARKFRDEMVQQFPGDYKDAWVSENPQK